MKLLVKLVVPALFFALVLAVVPATSSAQEKHPAYLHALSDLRAARAHLNHHDGGELRHEEKEAIHHIDDAIQEIKKAAIDDGKDLNDHPPVDAGMEYVGRLRRARQVLGQAREDISHEEDNPSSRGLQQRAFHHIDQAIHEVDEAIRIVESRH